MNGRMSGDVLSIGPGIDRMDVGLYGTTATFTFTAYDDFKVDEAIINGHVTCTNTIVIRGRQLLKMQSLTINRYGTLELDGNAQSGKTWTGYSVISTHNVYINGDGLKGGRLLNHQVNTTDGWDGLQVNASGKIEFEPQSTFYLNLAEMNGQFESYTPITMMGFFTTTDKMHYKMGSQATTKFDSLSSHPLGPWAGESYILADLLVTESQSTFYAGNTKFDVRDVSIDGTLHMQPTSEVKIMTFNISGLVNATTPIVLRTYYIYMSAGTYVFLVALNEEITSFSPKIKCTIQKRAHFVNIRQKS